MITKETTIICNYLELLNKATPYETPEASQIGFAFFRVTQIAQ